MGQGGRRVSGGPRPTVHRAACWGSSASKPEDHPTKMRARDKRATRGTARVKEGGKGARRPAGQEGQALQAGLWELQHGVSLPHLLGANSIRPT